MYHHGCRATAPALFCSFTKPRLPLLRTSTPRRTFPLSPVTPWPFQSAGSTKDSLDLFHAQEKPPPLRLFSFSSPRWSGLKRLLSWLPRALLQQLSPSAPRLSPRRPPSSWPSSRPCPSPTWLLWDPALCPPCASTPPSAAPTPPQTALSCSRAPDDRVHLVRALCRVLVRPGRVRARHRHHHCHRHRHRAGRLAPAAPA
mmetsp:Transcript_18145/g.68780  ORF Transcript_18145/g.68780 Transcript_18145/m.68780 type:complete len:200 (-) Transcript_18145:156-755(-)